ncbi:hypothetical protein [Helicobacter rodentium]|uniref:hypothetical protein n=1 Tax=Helicobacter rodentium TaxID=59617 RepID=UPI0025581B8E|nr:hypothetical protein [Helicobacter rodentium]
MNQQTSNLESLLQKVSHTTEQTLFEMLQNKERLEQGGQNAPQNPTDSITQTLLKESKESRKA